ARSPACTLGLEPPHSRRTSPRIERPSTKATKHTKQQNKVLMSPKILVVSPSAEVSEIAREMAPKGFDTLVVTDSEVVSALPGTEYMICYPHVPMKDAFYKAVPQLRLVQLLSAGYDNVDLEAARRAKVPLSNNGGANAISVSEHAMMLMLTVARKVIWQHGSASGGRWRGNGPAPRMYELDDKTLG